MTCKVARLFLRKIYAAIKHTISFNHFNIVGHIYVFNHTDCTYLIISISYIS